MLETFSDHRRDLRERRGGDRQGHPALREGRRLLPGKILALHQLVTLQLLQIKLNIRVMRQRTFLFLQQLVQCAFPISNIKEKLHYYIYLKAYFETNMLHFK